MCGIAGFVGQGNRADLGRMGERIIHRGPDGEGTFVDEGRGVFLLHRRLAILDIAGGDQPMWNEDGRIGVIFNGEIYNHLELREELLRLGHRFRSDHSDTEVLVHGYEEWGEDLPLRLNGMFAFAIYDAPRRRMFLSRDRFGKKPLYYYLDSSVFAFSSELTSLLAHPGVPARIDRTSLQKLLAYGFIPSPRSLYRDIRRLPGGHSMSFQLDAPGRADARRYWQFSIEPASPAPVDAEQKWGEELRHLLSAAVKRRLMSDVPLGIFLSGGVDSSAILAFASSHLPPGQISTFAIGFREPSFDESAHARAVAAHFGTAHHEQILDIDQARDLVPEILGRLDEPFGDPSLIPTYQLCRFARRRITVALGGDGGDELFAGYDPFKALAVARWYHAVVPDWVKRGVRSLAELIPVSERNMSLDFKIKRGLRGASRDPALWNPVWLGPLDNHELSDVFHEPVSPESLYEEALTAWEDSRAESLVDKTLEFYTRFYLQDDILVKADRAAMMVSLEVRSPFLDNELVEFARRLPHQFKFRDGRTKVLLKSALRGVVPDAVLDRRKKGFGIPLTSWLRSWSEADFERAGEMLANPAWVRKTLSDHKAGRRDNRLVLWCLLALQHHGRAVGLPEDRPTLSIH